MTALLEMEKLEKLKKIGVGLLILSLLISLFVPNLVFLFINLMLLSLVSIIRFRAVRYIMLILSICSVYFFCLTIILPASHYSSSLALFVGIIQVLLMLESTEFSTVKNHSLCQLN